MKRALITGISGQDGFFLTEQLLSKGYEVTGFTRASTSAYTFKHKVNILHGDIANADDINAAIQTTMPDELYHLASQSSPASSWAEPVKTLEANGLGALNILEAVRTISPQTRVFHPSSSEMYGRTAPAPQNEATPFNPSSPYAASRLYAHQMGQLYRESYQLFITNGILFNHESERRPLHFVTQKITYGAACASLGIKNSPDKNEKGEPIVSNGKLALGHLEVARDWGYAPDVVHAMWLMLQQDKPDDFVIGTGQLHTLKELCDIAYRDVGHHWQDHVLTDPAFIRPLDISQTVADATKAKRILGWKPSINFDTMIQQMVKAQIKKLRLAEKSSTTPTTVS